MNFSSDRSASTAGTKQVSLPRMYHVILIGDKTTPTDFVCEILQKLFRHDETAASRISSDSHCRGRSIAGTYTHDIAEAKAAQVVQAARLRAYPLRCVIEPEERQDDRQRT